MVSGLVQPGGIARFISLAHVAVLRFCLTRIKLGVAEKSESGFEDIFPCCNESIG